MIFELLLIFPLYTIIFGIFFRFRHVIIKMTEINDIFSAMSSEVEEVSKQSWSLARLANKAGSSMLAKNYLDFIDKL